MKETEMDFEEGTLKVVCCVCGDHVETKPSHGAPGGVSHGFCDECYEVAIEQAERELGEKLAPEPA